MRMFTIHRHQLIGLLAAAICLRVCAAAVAAESTYSETVLKDRPIAYFRFDETAGEAAADATGNGHDAVYKGDVTLGEPSAFPGLGAAALFGGKDGRVQVPRHKAFKFEKKDFTIEFWFNCKETLSTRGDLFTFKGKGKDFGVFKPVGNTNLIGITRPYRPFQAQTDPFSIGVWHHAAFVRKSAVDRWYLDGVASGPSVGNEQTIDMDADLLIGVNHYGDPNRLDTKTAWNGLIDEVAIYGAALTDRQIESHFKAAKESAR
jgi:trimeric autotransporter adhesin